MGVDFDILAKTFNQWAQNYVHVDASEWFGIDGKSIKGTVQDYESKYQNFVSIMSVFAQNRGLVLSLDKLESKKGREITTLCEFDCGIGYRGCCFKLGCFALSKKTCKLITNGGNAERDRCQSKPKKFASPNSIYYG